MADCLLSAPVLLARVEISFHKERFEIEWLIFFGGYCLQFEMVNELFETLNNDKTQKINVDLFGNRG